jgi:Rieske Fe-S protein
MNEQKYTRRDFIKRSIKFIAAAVLFPFLINRNNKAEGKSSKAIADGSFNISLDLGDKKYASLKEAGGSAYVSIKGKQRPAIVHRISDNKVVAFSSKCTHMGCKVNLPINGEVQCPCHGSLFDDKGKLIHGPAKSDLESYSAKLKDSTITISG